MKVKQYRELIVWQKAMDLVVATYRLVKLLPKDEAFALSSQMRRAVVSIPSNIAEGQSRSSTKEFANFLSIAKGSNAELETQIEVGVRLGFFSSDQIETPLSLANEVGRMLTVLIAKLSTPTPTSH